VSSTPADVSVIVVTYNSRPFIGDCLSSLMLSNVSTEVVVIDNASADETAAEVRATHPDTKVIELARNVGFAGAVNIGIGRTSGRNVLLLNPDAVVRPDTLQRLVAFLDREPSAGVAAPRLLNPDGSDQRTARSFPTPAAALFGRRSPLTRWWPNNSFSARYLSTGTPSAALPFQVDWVSGACLMVPRRVVDHVGPLDLRYFMYWEDADWCRRIRSAGYRVFCVPAAEAVHAEGSCRRGWPSAQLAHFHRSAYHYYARHHLQGSRAIARPAAAAVLTLRAGALMAVGELRARNERKTLSTADAAGNR
jgi:GT2 family glycosyltransferase